jgi:hypothetical protein
MQEANLSFLIFPVTVSVIQPHAVCFNHNFFHDQLKWLAPGKWNSIRLFQQQLNWYQNRNVPADKIPGICSLKIGCSGLFGFERINVSFFLEIVDVFNSHEDAGFFNVAEARIECSAKA